MKKILIHRSINNKNPTDLLKFYGPSKETLLMWLIKESCRERDVQSLRKIRAQIFAFLSRVLEESNEEAISMIIRKSDFGSALGMISHSILYKISTYLIDLVGNSNYPCCLLYYRLCHYG